MLVFLAACGVGFTPGWSPSDPTVLTCGCDEAVACYDAVAALDSREGETAENADELIYLAQCACFLGSMAGCNTLGHYAKDWVHACERGEDVARSCGIAGAIYHHGVRVPHPHGRSVPHDPAAAKAAFDRACQAGSKTACAAASK